MYRFSHTGTSSNPDEKTVQVDIVYLYNTKAVQMQYNQNMDDFTSRQDRNVGLPFYIFITILLGSIGIYGFRSFWQAKQPALAVLSSILLLIHLGIYWLNLRQFERLRWWWFYYFVQTILILAIANLPSGGDHDSFSLIFLGSGTISIIAESFGLWGNTRRAILLGLFYVAMLLGLFYLKVEPDLLLSYLSELLINGGFIILIMIVFNQQLKERQKAEEFAESLESANAKLAAYAARNEALTLQAERERMARELHDTLAQGVAGLILNLEAIKAHQRQRDHTQAEQVLLQALDRARNTLSESRAAIEDLRNDNLDFQTTVEKMVTQFQATGKSKFQLEIQLDAGTPLPQHIQHHARRVLHEALTNIQKHARAEAAQVSVLQSKDSLILRVQDGGVGFYPHTPPAAGHYGLQGFQERAQLTNSRYSLHSTPGEGTSVEFVFPLQDLGELA